MASCQATRTPRAAENPVAVRFGGLPAPIQALQNGTIVANARLRRGAATVSSRCVGWRYSNPSPCWLRRGTALCRPSTRFASKDLEGFVEDRSQLRKDRASTNPATFVKLAPLYSARMSMNPSISPFEYSDLFNQYKYESSHWHKFPPRSFLKNHFLSRKFPRTVYPARTDCIHPIFSKCPVMPQ